MPRPFQKYKLLFKWMPEEKASGKVNFLNLDQKFSKKLKMLRIGSKLEGRCKMSLLKLHGCFRKHIQVSLILLLFFGLLELVFELFHFDIGDHVLSLIMMSMCLRI